MPHATIGVGIFMAASLHAPRRSPNCPYHEYQHSVFDRNLAHVDTTMRCEAGHYTLPRGRASASSPARRCSAFGWLSERGQGLFTYGRMREGVPSRVHRVNRPYRISNSPAAPMPPPTHIVTTTCFAPRRLPSMQRVAGEPRARHAVRMADGDRAAVDVEAIVRNAERVAAVDHLHGERLVQLPEVDVVDLDARPLEQLRHREHRADAHLVGLAAGDGEAAEHAERRRGRVCAACVALITTQRRRAVGELARVAGRDRRRPARAGLIFATPS